MKATRPISHKLRFACRILVQPSQRSVPVYTDFLQQKSEIFRSQSGARSLRKRDETRTKRGAAS
ncbi:MAG: hypothetical protein MUE44_14755 [Oscillatoriaceae cyanobacterium Prado104]|nr:hypothetical protein [Oscillatoriaceae cyanobacterium Prado104]